MEFDYVNLSEILNGSSIENELEEESLVGRPTEFVFKWFLTWIVKSVNWQWHIGMKWQKALAVDFGIEGGSFWNKPVFHHICDTMSYRMHHYLCATEKEKTLINFDTALISLRIFILYLLKELFQVYLETAFDHTAFVNM